jgi:hypothetical protein
MLGEEVRDHQAAAFGDAGIDGGEAAEQSPAINPVQDEADDDDVESPR